MAIMIIMISCTNSSVGNWHWPHCNVLYSARNLLSLLACFFLHSDSDVPLPLETKWIFSSSPSGRIRGKMVMSSMSSFELRMRSSTSEPEVKPGHYTDPLSCEGGGGDR